MNKWVTALAVVAVGASGGCKRDTAPAATVVDAGAVGGASSIPRANTLPADAGLVAVSEDAGAGSVGDGGEGGDGGDLNGDAGGALSADGGANDAGTNDGGETAALPKSRFPNVPGWLGFATRAEGDGMVWFTPAHPNGEVVTFSGLESVKPGTKLMALDHMQNVAEVTALGTSEERYGCEQNTARMTGFDAPKPMAEGPVWLVPPGSTGVAALPIESLPAAKGAKSRTWKVDGLELVARTVAPLKGTLEVKEGGKVSATADFEKGYMEGGDADPYDLSDDNEVGLPVPMGAFRLGEGGPLVVVLKRSGYEGVSFQLVVKRGDAKATVLEDSEGLYVCAF